MVETIAPLTETQTEQTSQHIDTEGTEAIRQEYQTLLSQFPREQQNNLLTLRQELHKVQQVHEQSRHMFESSPQQKEERFIAFGTFQEDIQTQIIAIPP